MQGLADGYFVIPYTLAHYLASTPLEKRHDATTTRFARPKTPCQTRHRQLLAVKGSETPRAAASPARPDPVGRRRHVAQRGGPAVSARRGSRSCARSSGRTSRCLATPNNLNKNLEYAGRVADYLEFAELLAHDALERTESCGGHFREESQTPDQRSPARRRSTSRTWRRGSSAAWARRPCCTRSRWRSSTSSRRSGATSDEIHLRVWRQAGPAAKGRLVDYTVDERLAGHVVPRDARRRQRGADQEGRGADRVRLGLPRRHLRRVRVSRQRPAARARPGHDGVPAPHAAVQGRRHASRSSRGGRAPSPSCATSSSIAPRSTASSRPAATRR